MSGRKVVGGGGRYRRSEEPSSPGIRWLYSARSFDLSAMGMNGAGGGGREDEEEFDEAPGVELQAA